jgi:hypothetical protein
MRHLEPAAPLAAGCGRTRFIFEARFAVVSETESSPALTRRAIMRIPLLVLAFGVALAAALPARADVLQGDRFITAMKDNTVSGKTAAGASYNLYFLPGGAVTYRDASGRHVGGRWRLDRVGDVCVSWHGDTALPTGCYRVRADDRRLTWSSKAAHSDETLRGAVINAFLTR